MSTFFRYGRAGGACATVASLVLGGCGASQRRGPNHSSVRAIAQEAISAPRIAQRVQLGGALRSTDNGDVLATDAVVPGFGALWIVNDHARTLYKLDPKTLRILLTRRLPSVTAAQLSLGAGSLWVPLQSGYVERLDPHTGKLLAEVRVGPDPSWIVTAAGHIWVADRGDGMVRWIDPKRNAVTRTVRVRPGLYTIVAAPRGLWATVESDSDPEIVELDRKTGRVLRRVSTAETLYLANAGGFADGTLWAATKSGGVIRLDPRTGRAIARIDNQAFDVWTAGDQVWTTWPPDGEIQPIDPRTNRPGKPLKVGAEKEALALAFGSVWAVDTKTSFLTRVIP